MKVNYIKWMKHILYLILGTLVLLIVMYNFRANFRLWIDNRPSLFDKLAQIDSSWEVIIPILGFLFISVSISLFSKQISYFHRRFIHEIRLQILRVLPHEENTYSLFDDFDQIKFENDDSLEPDFTLNGLVRGNNEHATLHVEDMQIESLCTTITEKLESVKSHIGDTHFIRSESEWEQLMAIYSFDSIKNAIGRTSGILNDKENTFRFIADQYGISGMSQTGKTLTVKYYKTTYYTFRMFNNLFDKVDENKKFLSSLIKRLIDNISDDNYRKDGFTVLFPIFSSLGVNLILTGERHKDKQVIFRASRSKNVFDPNKQRESRRHVPMNETMSFTDRADHGSNPDILKCVKRGIHEELGIYFNDLKIDLHDIFINPQRGMLGLSVYHNLEEINPDKVKYYPGVDKTMEYDGLELIAGVKTYDDMIHKFIDINNSVWMPYTPYLFKRYYIRQKSIRSAANSINKKYIEDYIIYLLAIILISVATGYLFFILKLKFILLEIFLGALIAVTGSITLEKIKQHLQTWSQRRRNKPLETLGADPYCPNAIMYTGQDLIKCKDVLIAVNNNATTTLDFSQIEIVAYEARIRKISEDNEWPTLLLKAKVKTEESTPMQKNLVIRNYFYGENKSNKLYIKYFEENDKISFGINMPASDLFELEARRNNTLSEHALKALSSDEGLSIFHLRPKAKSEIELYDIFKQGESDDSSIIITRLVSSRATDKNAREITGATKKELEENVIELIETSACDKLDVLMLQQILIRKDITLLKEKVYPGLRTQLKSLFNKKKQNQHDNTEHSTVRNYSR